jgi:hypothetical protein
LAWDYRESEDELTGKIKRSAAIRSTNTLSLDSPYDGPQRGMLLVRNHPNLGRDVLVTIQRGQILCPSYGDCRVTVRIDDEEPERWRAAGSSDGSSNVVFISRSADFVRRLRDARIVRIGLEIYQEGIQVLLFDVAGYDDARVHPPEPRRRRARPRELWE